MAANYWASTQRLYWQFSRIELQEILLNQENKDQPLTQQYPLPDRRMLSIFYNQQLGKLAKRMSVRQQALATAQLYIRRFYVQVDVRNTNPYLLLVTALYLACKVEESPQHIRVVVDHAKNLWPGEGWLRSYGSPSRSYISQTSSRQTFPGLVNANSI